MLRYLLLAFAFVAPVFGQIHALGPGRDINQGISLNQLVFVDWVRSEGTHLVGIDPVKHNLILAQVNKSMNSATFTRVLKEDLPYNSQIFLAEIDTHAGADVVLLTNDEAFVWTSGSRNQTPDAGPDLQFSLPRPLHDLASRAVVADFDQDAKDDLLLPGFTNSGRYEGVLPAKGCIIFSFGKPDATVVPLPSVSESQVTIGPPWTQGGPPVIVFANSQLSAPLTLVIGVNTDRSFATLESFETDGCLVDLDGTAPPEWLQNRYLNTNNTITRAITVSSRRQGIWAVTATVPLNGGTLGDLLQFFPGDYDHDGRQEVIISRNNGNSLERTTNLTLISTTGNLLETVATELPLLVGTPLSLQTLAIPRSEKLALLSFHQSTDAMSPFGYPTTLPGLGYRARIRNVPLDPVSSREWYPFGDRLPRDIAIAKINSDPLSDLVMLTNGGSIESKLGPLAGAAEPKTITRTMYGYDSMILGDFDGDGDSDPILARTREIQTLNTTRQDPFDPIFNFQSEFKFAQPTALAPTRLLGSGDFDGDGDLDPLLIDPTSETLSWAENTGAGNLGTLHQISLAGRVYRPWIFPISAGYQWISQSNTLVVDIDHDGDADIITIPSALGNRLTLHRNTPVGFTLEALSPPLRNFPASQAFVPSEESAKLHLGRFYSSTEPLQMAISVQSSSAFGSPLSVVWLLHGDINELTISTPIFLSEITNDLVTVDFDQNGLDDFIGAGALTSDMFGNPIISTNLTLYRNLGGGKLAQGITLASTIGITSTLRAGDLDGDGLPDIVAASIETGTVEIFRQKVVPAVPNYATWTASYGLGTSGPNHDPDHDGIVNLLEYAAGTFPGGVPPSPDSSPPPPAAPLFDFVKSDVRFCTASHPRPRQLDGAPLEIELEHSADLQEWTKDTTYPVITVDPAHPEWETINWYINPIDITDGETPPKLFHRFRVTLPPVE